MRAGIDLALPGRQRSGGGAASPLPGPIPAIDVSFAAGLAWQNGQPYNSAAAQLTTVRASAGYADDTAGNWTLFANNVPRITNKGLLVEESRTNSIRNSAAQGAVPGTPGTQPTNWQVLSNGGLTTSVIGSGTQNGVDYLDLRIAGTAGGTFYVYSFDSGPIVAAPNDVWSESLFAALIGGSLAGITSTSVNIRFVGGNVPTIPFAITATLSRYSGTATAAAGTTGVTPAFFVGLTNGAAIDATFRIGWPQLELGAFATSPIRTTNAAVTRAADFITVTNPPSPLVFPMTFFVRGTPIMPIVAGGINENAIGVDDGSNSNRVSLYRGAANNIVVGVGFVSGAGTFSVAGSAWSQGVSGKVALAVQASDQALSFNGGAVTAATNPSVPAGLTRMPVGCGGPGPFNGYVERVSVFLSRLANATLQSITGPAYNPFPMSGAALDLDFVNNAAYPADIAKLLTTTRASLAWADDNSGKWTQFANNVPRITNKGLLVEESRTNSIRNNSMQGGIAGTPGTRPTNWGNPGIVNGVTTTLAYGTENGIDYIEITVSGVAGSGGLWYWTQEAVNQIAAASGQVWDTSFFMKYVSAVNPPDGVIIRTQGTNGATATETFPSSALSVPVGGNLGQSRFSLVSTLANAGTTNIVPGFAITHTIGNTYNYTIRIGWPQLELGAFVTSPIRTVNAAVLRNFDSVLLANPPALPGSYSMFAQGVPQAPISHTVNQTIMQIDLAATPDSQRVVMRRNANNGTTLIAQVGGSGISTSPGTVWAQSVRGKIATAQSVNDQAGIFNGLNLVTGAGASLPTAPDEVRLGRSGNTTEIYNGYIERAAIWNSRLSNANLQALTRQ